MNWSIIHDNNWPWRWIFIAERQDLVFNELFEQFRCIWAMENLICNVSIQCICRKDGPSLRALYGPCLIAWDSFWRPSKLTIHIPFIGSQFIDEDKLLCIPHRQATYPVISELLITLSSTLFGLMHQPQEINDLWRYTALRVHPRCFRTLLRVDWLTMTSYSSHKNHCISSKYAVGLSSKNCKRPCFETRQLWQTTIHDILIPFPFLESRQVAYQLLKYSEPWCLQIAINCACNWRQSDGST